MDNLENIVKPVIEYTKKNVRPKRFQHIENVVTLSHKLALALNLNPIEAIVAGYLHDSLKEEKSSNLIAIAKQYKMPLSDIDLANGHLLHGPVASLVAKSKFNILNKDVLDAIAYHTLGHKAMCNMAKVVFLSDCLEEDRDINYTYPIWISLLNLGKSNKKKFTKKFISNLNFNDYQLNVDKAILTACNQNIKYLIVENKIIHPQSIEARNYYLAKCLNLN